MRVRKGCQSFSKQVMWRNDSILSLFFHFLSFLLKCRLLYLFFFSIESKESKFCEMTHCFGMGSRNFDSYFFFVYEQFWSLNLEFHLSRSLNLCTFRITSKVSKFEVQFSEICEIFYLFIVLRFFAFLDFTLKLQKI